MPLKMDMASLDALATRLYRPGPNRKEYRRDLWRFNALSSEDREYVRVAHEDFIVADPAGRSVFPPVIEFYVLVRSPSSGWSVEATAETIEGAVASGERLVDARHPMFVVVASVTWEKVYDPLNPYYA